MLKKFTFRNKIKKIIGVSAIAFCSLTVAACSGGTEGIKEEASADQGSEADEIEDVTGTPLPRYDVSEKLKAKGEKVDISGMVEKYKPMVKLADHKGIAVTKDEVYEMTDEDVEEELEILLENFKSYEDVTQGGTAQEKDALTLTSNASVDGQPYENLTFEDMYYEIGSELVAEDFDKQLVGKKAGEDFEINVQFPDDYVDAEMLEDGEVSLNGKTVSFKVNISKIERPANETMNDEWVKNHQEELSYYNYNGVNTLDELKKKIKTETDESRAVALVKQFGTEALEKVVESSEFLSFPEDELKTLKDQTMSNIQQEFEAYKDMMEVKSLEEYLEMAYEISGDSGLEDYATKQAQEYLKTKMVMILIADEAGIEIGEEDVKSLGDDMAAYYGMESYETMLQQYGDSVRESAVFETIYDKVVSYLGSVADPSLEPEESEDFMTEDLTVQEQETSAAG